MMRSVLFLVIGLTSVILLLAGGCSTKNTGLAPSPASLLVSAVPAPEGVDPAVWADLTSELIRVVTASGKTVSTPPLGIANGSRTLMVTDNGNGTCTLTWSHFMIGDTDQNGEVNISDLTPIGQHLNKTSASPDWTTARVADTDGNGEINISDVTPVGQHFKEQVSAYQAFANPDNQAYPTSDTAANGAGTRGVLEVPFTSGVANANNQLVFTVIDTAPNAGEYYWVRGSDAAGDMGTASNLAQPLAVGSWTMNLHPGTPANAGTGTQADPYLLTVDGYYALQVIDPVAVLDVTTQCTFTSSSPQSTGVNAIGEIEMAGGHNTAFDLTATKAGQTIVPATIYFDFSTPGPNTNPTAAYTINADTGPAPLDVTFDASTSSDPDVGDSIALYQWDFDGDGTYDHSTTSPITEYSYLAVGSFFPVLQVTDTHGATDTTSKQITVTSAIIWNDSQLKSRGERVTIDLNGLDNPCIAAARFDGIDFFYGNAATGGTFSEVTDITTEVGIAGFWEVDLGRHFVGGTYVPVLAYTCGDTNDGTDLAKFVRALNADGSTWGTPVELARDVVRNSIALAVWDGKIYVFFVDNGGNLVVKSSSDDGATFPNSFTLDNNGDVTYPISAVVNGMVGVAYSTGSEIRYRGSSDATVTVWNPVKVIASGGVYRTLDLAVINLVPAIVFADTTDIANMHATIYFNIAADQYGSNWASPAQVHDAIWNFYRQVALAEIGGKPAIVIANDPSCHYIRALDARGTLWGPFDNMANANYWYADMVGSSNGHPLIVIGEDAGRVDFVTY